MNDDLRTLRTFLRHLTEVRRGLLSISQHLEMRALLHDFSKLEDDEFPGFVLMQEGLKESKPELAKRSVAQDTLFIHYGRNRHHPEHHPDASVGMTWLDLIEMVVDWRAAWKTYGSRESWKASVEAQRTRYNLLSESQWWLIEQISDWLEEKGA